MINVLMYYRHYGLSFIQRNVDLDFPLENITDKITVAQQIGSESSQATAWNAFINLSGEEPNLHQVVVKISPVGTGDLVRECQIGEEFFSLYPQYIVKTFTVFEADFVVGSTNYGKNEFLVLEKTCGDLKQYLETFPDSVKLAIIIRDVIDAVYFLAWEQNFHLDLHIGNVFIVLNDETLNGVLGDFGTSGHIDVFDTSVYDLFKIWVQDLKSFFKTLRSSCNNKFHYEILPIYRIFLGKVAKSLLFADELIENFDKIEYTVKTENPENIESVYRELLYENINRFKDIWL